MSVVLLHVVVDMVLDMVNAFVTMDVVLDFELIVAILDWLDMGCFFFYSCLDLVAFDIHHDVVDVEMPSMYLGEIAFHSCGC